ncbi:efflux RND transporter permease subunit [Desulfopila aestuarii]|uniref:Multidrug efflux pump n=1 Tax=Desulfopila aestuarii DSM 18488 TaxID=1121416 RepID=A0A1M7XW22_9BACT|nr:multidrug efflux RND transporter permease subunit [Desulfopila aestuarii]SHO42666.1 multidrug efflux pump [Desulfopila aestuarii DSM 18488]
MAKFFIDRPVFAMVISIVIVLGGFVSMQSTPIAQYPDIAPPTVQVTALYPGATAEVIANTVAAPLEAQINGVENMSYMLSTSSSTGNMTLTVTFEPGTDPNQAQVNVQNRVSQASAKLPEVVAKQGVTVETRSQAFMMAAAFYTDDDRYDQTYLSNYVNLYILDPIKRLPGANLSSMFPVPDIAMRIWLKPDRLAQLGLTATDVSNAIKRQNQAFGIGQIGQAPATEGIQQSFVVTTKGMLTDPSEFNDIIIRAEADGSAIVRLKDIGHAELGSQNYSMTVKIDGKRAAGVIVYQQPGANAIATSARVRELIEELKPGFPDGLKYKYVIDTSEFTAASIEKVVHTFFEAVVLVVLVVLLFLQSFRATFIPILAVPICIVGTYTGIYFLGFSTNMLTLFGMILAIGLVVDDAIIVVEAVEVHMAAGLSPIEAARKAMDELSGALVAIVLVLVSVFLPVAFLGGLTGTLYKQFAITIAISMVISGIVALTLSPALAARILKPGAHEKKGFSRWFNKSFDRLTDGYIVGVRFLINHKIIGLGLFGGVVYGVILLFGILPGSFVPAEDQGYLFGVNIMPDAASLERTTSVSDQAVKTLHENNAVSSAFQVDGYSLIDSQNKTNSSTLFVALKPYVERTGEDSGAFTVLDNLRRNFSAIKEGIVIPLNPPSIPGLGTTGGFEFYIQNMAGASSQDLEKITKGFIAKTRERAELAGVSSTFSASQQQLYFDLDRNRAELLGVPVSDIYGTLQAYFGSSYVAQYVQFGRIWQVIIQAQAEYRDEPTDFDQIYVRSTRDGEMIPLSALATVRYVPGAGLLPRFNGFPAAKLTGSQATGYSTGQAITAMEEVAKEVLPDGYGFSWAGQAFEEKKSGGTSSSAFIFGLIMVFLILAAQYEKWSLPIGVMMAVPFAICGALLATWGRGLENDVYFQVGLVTLVGLSAKNAILIIEFAVENVHHGMTVVDAAVEAARLRLRPIVMTSLAFILGCVPMAIATGAGANSLHAIGTGVIGGMLASTAVASFFVPLFFVIIENASGLFTRKKKTIPPVAATTGGDHHA